MGLFQLFQTLGLFNDQPSALYRFIPDGFDGRPERIASVNEQDKGDGFVFKRPGGQSTNLVKL